MSEQPQSVQPPHERTSGRAFAARAVSTLSAAAANVPENAAYGLIALAPLGLAFGQVAMALAVLGAVVANLVANTLGAGRLASGPRSSLALLTAGLVASLASGPVAEGTLGILQVLVCLAFALVGAGLLQCAFGWLGLGQLVKYTPYPVRLGLTSGVGLLLLLTALPVTFGQAFGSATLLSGFVPDWRAAKVGAVAFVVCGLSGRYIKRLPAALVALVAATLLHALLTAQGGAIAWGPTLGVPQLPSFDAGLLRQALSGAIATVDFKTGTLLAVYAVTVALLCSLDTLIACSIVDGRLRQQRNANRELVAQGLSNIAAALCGGQAASPSIARTLALVAPQPLARHVVVGYALVMLAVVLLVPQVIGMLPVSALGGILALQGAQMVAPTLWQAPKGLLRREGRQAGAVDSQTRTLAGNWAVTVTVTLSALVLGLGPAVLIGATFAVLLFVRSNMRNVVRHIATGETRRSLKVRPSHVSEALRREGHRIALFELEGSLFFGTADALRSQLQHQPETVDTAILDLRQVQDIDVTAARILTEAADDWSRSGRQLVFAEWLPGDGRRKLLEAMVDGGSGQALHFTDDADAGLEKAEDRLVERLHLEHLHDDAIPLSDTMLLRGLPPAACAVVESSMQRLTFAKGTVLFRLGDTADGLYVVTQGEVGLRMPGSMRRLASFAAGVTLGEIAMLTRSSRSAEAVAESDVAACFLPAAAFDRLLQERPEIASLLLQNMAVHLADRVRGLTNDLSHWVGRSAAKRTGVDQSLTPSHSSEDGMNEG